MLIELDDTREPLDSPTHVERARYAAWLAWQFTLGVSFVGFWLLVAAMWWLGARPVGRVIWEPPAREAGP